ncbi:FxSxx-COOH cyclophane-containing RiPP peptide [Actinomadura hibisca]|uniref:FxSxx-COOH cyclophane-containing RiPP peptide n=1 Tax=Actinomadura hibisca TaxID=68565 RepID=UPI0008344CB4|nr:FxSxx-COOH cyclophane-containing RiPP peptide [Actinomadura hibisca]
MPEQTMPQQSGIVDVSDLSLQVLDELDGSAIMHALRDVLDPGQADTEVVAGFESGAFSDGRIRPGPSVAT